MLGGSSSINAMIYIRGSRYDYDTWRDEYGCDGWGYTDLLPYFLRAEDNSRGESAFHGASGPLSVQDLRYKSSLTGAFVAAAAGLRRARQRRLQRRRSRTASATTRSPSAAAAAGRRPTPTCTRPPSGPT